MAGFSQLLFTRIERIYHHILQHPFVVGLTDGTLDADAFRFYAIQDALYLRDFARGLSLLAAKSPGDETAVMFNDHAKNAIVVERALHGSFFTEWQLSPEEVYATPAIADGHIYVRTTGHLYCFAVASQEHAGRKDDARPNTAYK